MMRIQYRKFLAADIEGVESVGAVGAVFKAVFFGFGEFFTGLCPCGIRGGHGSLRRPVSPGLNRRCSDG